MYIKWNCSDRVEKKWQLYIIYLNVLGIKHRHTKYMKRIQKSTWCKCCKHRKVLF